MDIFMLFQVQTADGNINSEPATEPKKLQTTASKYIQSKHCSTINGHLRLDVKSKTMSNKRNKSLQPRTIKKKKFSS